MKERRYTPEELEAIHRNRRLSDSGETGRSVVFSSVNSVWKDRETLFGTRVDPRTKPHRPKI